MELAAMAAFKNNQPIDFTEDDLDILAESIEVLNTVYETLYDKVFVTIEEN